MFKSENIIQRTTQTVVFKDIDKYTTTLSNEIILFLGDELDELNVSSSIFRVGIRKSIERLLRNLDSSENTVTITPDGIPGFTLLAYKKSEEQFFNSTKINKVTENNTENEIIHSVIESYFIKSKKKVIVFDNEDLRLILFPVSDTKKNLKELDLYIT